MFILLGHPRISRSFPKFPWLTSHPDMPTRSSWNKFDAVLDRSQSRVDSFAEKRWFRASRGWRNSLSGIVSRAIVFSRDASGLSRRYRRRRRIVLPRIGGKARRMVPHFDEICKKRKKNRVSGAILVPSVSRFSLCEIRRFRSTENSIDMNSLFVFQSMRTLLVLRGCSS